ncbi:MAG: carbohydrate binding domain-containing protein, partial [Candidatus Nealsonbacteria bacterium]|nr:carbohydrate binding domain-containing protein [Candidatus Nealsonbacteria bacterium]
FGEAEGFPGRDQRPDYDKGLDNFEPRMIELQKKYARDLLTHVNPYTKTAYAAEPAVAFVEISNEDALFAVWGWGQLDSLPEPYAGTFRKLFNEWLRKKYGTTERLRKAWNVGQRTLGDEMLVNGDFGKPLKEEWAMERDEETRVEWGVQSEGLGARGEGLGARPCLRIVVTRQGKESWRPQLTQDGLGVEKGTPYTLTFRVRADRAQTIGVNCMMAHDPWQRVGLSANVEVTTEWRQVRRTFVADSTDANARITFTGLAPGTYELAEVSLRPGGIVGLAADQTLEDNSVPVLRRNELHVTETARHDFIDFLHDTEQNYWHGMYRFLKDDLGVKQPISGTQLSYSPVYVQAGLDYIDAHSYWKHPHFPGRPWDSTNWTVHNVALVNSPGGTLAGLAVRRVQGMAFTVSEYNHPAPNAYAAEGFPMIAAYGAFQRWDGIFPFAYCHNSDFEPQRIGSFFDVKCHTAKLVHTPACAALFLRGDVAAARKTVGVGVSPDDQRDKLHESLSAWTLTAEGFGLDPKVSLLHGVAMQLGKNGPAAAEVDVEETNVFVSDTGELRWDVSQQGAGYFIADTPRTKLFTGFIRGRTFELGDVKLTIGKTRLDWATVSMVAVDGDRFDRPGRILIAATGWVQNTGAQLQQLSGDRVTLSNRWGSEPVLCEGVPVEIRLPAAADRVQLFPLDPSGNRRTAVDVSEQDGRAVLKLGPEHETVWYEVQVR